MQTVTGWRYYYRRYLGFLPVQFCMVCGRAHWAGFPRLTLFPLRWQWMPWWDDYCSGDCAEQEHKRFD